MSLLLWVLSPGGFKSTYFYVVLNFKSFSTIEVFSIFHRFDYHCNLIVCPLPSRRYLCWKWASCYGDGGGGGFFLACEDFRKMFDHSLLALFFFFFKVAVSSRRLIPFFMPGSVHSGSASWDDCGRMFPDKLRVSCFRIGAHTMPGQRHSQPIPISFGQGCMHT